MMKTPYLFPLCLLLMCSCGQTTKHQNIKADSTSSVTKADTGVNTRQSSTASPDISGAYKEMDDDGETEGCGITLNIDKAASGYSYHLKQDTISYSGKLTVTHDADKITFLVFEGIKYAEYEGDISQKEDDNSRPKLKSPVGIEGELDADTITIQNYGNSMNYYVKLGGCGVKYIRLVKTHK